MRQKAFLAATQLVTLPLLDGQLRILLRDAVPKILDQLKTFGSGELKQRREFGFHGKQVAAFSIPFNRGHTKAPTFKIEEPQLIAQFRVMNSSVFITIRVIAVHAASSAAFAS